MLRQIVRWSPCRTAWSLSTTTSRLGFRLYTPSYTAGSPELRRLHHFMVYAPDCTDNGAVERRFAVREKHLDDVAPLIADRTIKVAGMFVSPESVQSEKRSKMPKGSLLIVEAETIDEVHKMMKEDIYYTTKVWDPERLVILPFLPVTPLDK